MSRDFLDRRVLDERCAALFAAGRREPAPEATRQRISLALRARCNHAAATGTRRWRRPAAGVALIAAAGLLLVVGAFGLVQPDAEPVTISAEVARAPAASERAAERRALAPAQLPPSPSADPLSARQPAVERAQKREPVSLEEELASMQRARSALGRGNARAALAELDRFGRERGWRQLAVEARLLQIESLARAGRAGEARNLARRFVAQHPNNPLVDRARTFAAAPAPSGADGSPQENPDE